MNTVTSIWNSIQSVLLVVQFDQIDAIVKWRDAMKATGLNIHQCRILSVVASKKERQVLGEMSYVVFLSEGDFGLLGNLKHEDAQKLLGQQFDAVITIGGCDGKVGKAVRKVRKRFDIGLNTEKDAHEVSLISEEQTPEHLLNFVKQTLEKLS